MIRFAFTFSLFLLFIGCQTTGLGTKSTFFARIPKPATSVKQFWNKTAQFFAPDTGKRGANHESQFVSNRSHTEILPINRSSNSLYKPGSIFLAPSLHGQENGVMTAGTKESAVSEKSNPLQIQAGDSEAFQRLLREIAVIPPDKRNVDAPKLTELISSFRDEIMDSDFEEDYLALLRRRILPQESVPQALVNSKAPIPTTELADVKRSHRKFEMDFDDDFEDELPEPPRKRRLPNKDDSVIAQSTMPISAPVYPTLAQIPSAVPGVAQAAYQSPHGPNSAMTGFGAGDWQTPTRAAIEQLRYAIEQTPNGRTMSNEMRLRMLEMLLGNKGEAVKMMQTADKTINQFMGNQVLGFAALLDDTAPDTSGKYISAAYRFSEGLMDLQMVCPLKLKNVMFVKDWFEYGNFTPHPTQEFYPGESFKVYFEIDNLVVRQITAAEGYEFGVAVKYEIWDSSGKVVGRQDIGKAPGGTLSRKRDFCLGFPGMVPTSLPPGQYHLRISVTDLNTDPMQFAEEQIQFKVVPSQQSDEKNSDIGTKSSGGRVGATADRKRTLAE